MPDKQRNRQRQRQQNEGQTAREERMIRALYRGRRRNSKFVHVSYGETHPGSYKVSRSEMFMALAKQFKRPINEIKRIVGVKAPSTEREAHETARK